MGGKKKKKGKKGKKKKVEEEPDDEFMKMDLITLRNTIESLKTELQEAKEKRNYIQLERDTLNSFYLNTKKEVETTKNHIVNKEHEMEKLENDHRMHIQVYNQRVKHFQYEHTKNNEAIQAAAKLSMEKEVDYHGGTQNKLRQEKGQFKKDIHEEENLNIAEVSKDAQTNERKLASLREGFEANHQKLVEKYEQKLAHLKEDLELRQKVEIHEIEERKNQHINDLLSNHEEAFRNLKAYYYDITAENLALIKEQKETEANLEKRKAEIEVNIAHIEQQNKKLKEPLDKAREERKNLQAEVAGAEKCKMSLKNARARLVTLREQLEKTKKEKDELEKKYAETEKEKNELLEKFEQTIDIMKKRAEYKNVVLDGRLQNMEEEFERKEKALQEVLTKTDLDPRYVQEITKTIQESIETKNTILKNLQYSLSHATKAYNDAIRVYEAKLVEFGIPAEELGFQPLDTDTSTMPAGLVAA